MLDLNPSLDSNLSSRTRSRPRVRHHSPSINPFPCSVPPITRAQIDSFTQLIHHLEPQASSIASSFLSRPSSAPSIDNSQDTINQEIESETETEFNELDITVDECHLQETKRQSPSKLWRPRASLSLSSKRIRHQDHSGRWPLSIEEQSPIALTFRQAVEIIIETEIRKRNQQAGRSGTEIQKDEKPVVEAIIKSTTNFLDQILLVLAAAQPPLFGDQRRSLAAWEWQTVMALAGGFLPDRRVTLAAKDRLQSIGLGSADDILAQRIKHISRHTSKRQIETLYPRLSLKNPKRRDSSSRSRKKTRESNTD